MDIDTILSSDVFKYINWKIDTKVSKIEEITKVILNYSFHESNAYNIPTRIHEEKGLDNYMPPAPIKITPDSHEYLSYLFTELTRLKAEIAELQVDKCVLINDFDYTYGDDKVQKKIFG